MMKINKRGFELTCIMAFRYAINRHQTQAMGGILAGDGNSVQDVILDNLDDICTNFKCQMMNDIVHELEWYDGLKSKEEHGGKQCPTQSGHSMTVYSPHYLDFMLEELKKDYKKNHNGEEWHKGIQA